MASEAASKADFSGIRYAQCWEDADVLLEALDVKKDSTYVSIASAGDNTLALLARGPGRVLALDLSPVQLACLELRVAAYRVLEHRELLELVGSRASVDRRAHYQRCRSLLGEHAQRFWDKHPSEIAAGIGSAGKFERYFALFRKRILPLVHGRRRIEGLLEQRAKEQRKLYYEQQWNTWRWRTMFRIFFSRTVMGRLGRDPSFFEYVDGSVGDRILNRTAHALTELDPSENPYLQWILTGGHTSALPFALRAENFAAIRANLDKLEWHCKSLEEILPELGSGTVAGFNLSDIFEYMSEINYHRILKQLTEACRPGGRLVYWNMLAPRSRPDALADRLQPLADLAQRLHLADKAFFYSRLVVEEAGRW